MLVHKTKVVEQSGQPENVYLDFFWHTDWFGPHTFSCLFCWSWVPDLLSITAVLLLIRVVFLSLQHKYRIEKAELLTEIVSSLELFLLEQRCNMHWLEWLKKWSLELGDISQLFVFYFPIVFALYSNTDLSWPLGSSQLWRLIFSTSEKTEDLSVHTCPICLQQTTEFWRI